MTTRSASSFCTPSVGVASIELRNSLLKLIGTNMYGGQTAHSIVISVTGIVDKIWCLQRKCAAS